MTSNNIKISIAVVIVAYNPDKRQTANIKHLSSLYYGAIYDNSPKRNFNGSKLNLMNYLWSGRNIGIASAQNRAIESLTSFDYVVFLDQDSIVDDDYPIKIVNEYIKEKEKFHNIAILGPFYSDGESKDTYVSKIRKDKYINSALITRQNIISSGSCISHEILKDVGLNNEALFIDYVDSEWCWRANSKGYICCITTRLNIVHRIGYRVVTIGPIKDVISAPIRYYYQYRNYLWMLRVKYVPTQWKLNVGIKCILRFFYVPFLCDKSFQCLKYMIRGIYDGLKIPREDNKNKAPNASNIY